jgi:peroxiredoxin
VSKESLSTTVVPAVGSRFPDFTLRLATGEGATDFRLADHLGKGPVVLAFFPLAFTGVCTKQMCDFRDHLAAFAQLDAQVYGFSVDSAPSNRAFAKEQGLPFGILCDPNRDVVGRAWPADPRPVHGAKGVAKRGVVVLGPDGVVRWASVSEDNGVWIGTQEVRRHLA